MHALPRLQIDALLNAVKDPKAAAKAALGQKVNEKTGLNVTGAKKSPPPGIVSQTLGKIVG